MSIRTHRDVIELDLKDIEVPAGFRRPDPAVVADLAESIEVGGLLHPIGVRPGAQSPYTLIFGGHRLAAHRKLGLDSILASVFDMDAAEAGVATLAENLHRTSLKPAERTRFVKMWQEVYSRAHPESTGKQGMAAGHRFGKKKPEPGMPDPGTPERAPRFDQVASKVMGVSGQVVRRLALAGKTLSESDLDVLSARDVTQADIDRIVAIPDEADRKHAVALVASGLDVPTSLALATAPRNATLTDATVADPGIKPEHLMTDDEWLAFHCRDALDRLAYQDAFRLDAVAWRKLFVPLSELRKKAKPVLVQSKSYKPGPFRYRVGALLNLLHPNDWPMCGPCGGTGQQGTVGECSSCRGAGYALKMGAR